MKVIEWLTDNWTGIIAVWGSIVLLARAIIMLTPTRKDDRVMKRILWVLSRAGMHISDTPYKK